MVHTVALHSTHRVMTPCHDVPSLRPFRCLPSPKALPSHVASLSTLHVASMHPIVARPSPSGSVPRATARVHSESTQNTHPPTVRISPMSGSADLIDLSSYQAYERRLASAEGPATLTVTRGSSGSDTITPGGLTLKSSEGLYEPGRAASSPLLRGSALAGAASADLVSRGTREARETPLAAATVAESREARAVWAESARSVGGQGAEEGQGRRGM
ncbi:unnamed protein product [Closterium sp. NIES-53]